MRKVGALVSFFIALVLLALPAFAQAPAPAAAPKVTINGLVDFIATYAKNWSNGGSAGGAPAIDITDARDQIFYSRERGVFTITGEVGRSKGVLAVEIDFTNGAGIVGNSGNAFNGGTQGAPHAGTTANFDLDTDVAGVLEVKWLYLETPITGPGSMMPFIPVSSILRAGGQPFRGHDYKNGMHATGDFPGITIATSWAPNLRSTLSYVQIMERLDPLQAPNARDSWAVVASVEVDVFKGLTVKPTYSFVTYRGGNCGTNQMGTPATGGFQPNSCGAVPPTPPLNQHRHSFGGDVRWSAGPWSLQPTVFYQTGEQEVIFPAGTRPCPAGSPATGCRGEVDISAWIFDTIAGFRAGPLNLEGRLMYTTGMGAEHRVQNGADINYYRPINSGFGYMAGWSEIQTGGKDYAGSLFVTGSALTLRESASYDKYGRIFLGFAGDYALTPALSVTGLLNASWTPNKVDTRSVLTTGTGLVPCNATAGSTLTGASPTASVATGSCTSNGRGQHRFIGTEIAAGLTYRFAPNVALDLVGAYLFAGHALDTVGAVGAGHQTAHPRDAEDIVKLTARVRVTF